jgi:hypothetical protein
MNQKKTTGYSDSFRIIYIHCWVELTLLTSLSCPSSLFICRSCFPTGGVLDRYTTVRIEQAQRCGTFFVSFGWILGRSEACLWLGCGWKLARSKPGKTHRKFHNNTASGIKSTLEFLNGMSLPHWLKESHHRALTGSSLGRRMHHRSFRTYICR